MQKITLVLLTVGGIVLSASCKKNTCKKEPEIPDWCHLVDINPNHYEPVCGCDGETYQNSAVAECVAGITEYSSEKCK